MVLRRTIATLLFTSLLASAETVDPRIVERYKQMLAAKPSEGIALDRLWKIAVDEGGTEKLIAEYEKAADFSGQMILGHLLRKAGRVNDAADAFARAAKLDATSVFPLLALARIESERTQPRGAAEWLEKATALMAPGDPQMADTLLQLGAAWLSAGETVKAASAWERTVQLSPGNTALRRKLADTYVANLLPEAALKHLGFLAENAPPAERATAFQQIAKLKAGLGRADEAMQSLERAVALTAPGNWLRAELLGEMIRLAQRQHSEDGLESKWKLQVERDPRDVGGYLQLIEFYEKTGRLEDEQVWLEKLTAMLPKDADLRLKLARLLVRLDQSDRAASLYDELIRAQPGNVSLGFEQARIDIQREDAVAARDRIAALLTSAPGDETLRQKALDFYREHRMYDLIETHLIADAETGSEDAIVALANFHYSQRRNTEALAAVRRLIRPSDSAERRAAQHLQAAQLLKGQAELGAAIIETHAALALAPDSREASMLLGELELALGDFEPAREALLKTYALSADEAAQTEVDARLFETFRVEYSGNSDEALRRTKNTMAAQVEGFIGKLMRSAREQGNAAGWLRVARWKAWNNDKSSAVTFATKAADIEPNNPAPREFLARHLASSGDPAYALEHLRALLKMNPTRRSEYQREIAQLELLRGNTLDALKVLTDLVRANPGDPDTLSELAAAEERSGLLDDASTHWRKVLSLLPESRKREAAGALLRVLQRLDRHVEAAELLLRVVDGTKDERERFTRFDELLLHARDHGQLEWLRAKMEERRTIRMDDYFTTVALGRVLKLSGDKTGAFELFADAAFSAPNQASALPELVREAEELHRMDAAVRLQEQLTRVTVQSTPDGLLKLAALYQSTGDLDGAERTWRRAVAKFPRDGDVLRSASDFHREWGDRERAVTLLRKLFALEPANLRTAFDLGELEYQLGRFDDAKSPFESVMKLTKPVNLRAYPAEDHAGPWTSPSGASGIRTSIPTRLGVKRAGEWRILAAPSQSRPGSDDEMRLAALRRLAMIAAKSGGKMLASWVADWQPTFAAQPTEALWALYFSGAKNETLSHIETAMRDDAGDDTHRQAFLWLSLESGQFPRIGKWLAGSNRSAGDYTDFSVAFGEFVKNEPEAMGRVMLDGLFPKSGATRLWPSAVELARNQHFAEALELGTRAFAMMPTQQPAMGRELAKWHLAVGDPANARAVLERASTGGGDTFESPVYGAIRELYALLPDAEQPAFIAQRLKAADAETLHGMISRATLHSLVGERDAAAGELDRIANLRPPGLAGFDDINKVHRNAAIREWLFTLGTSGKLLEWNEPDLALHTLNRAFADEGLAQLQISEPVREEVPFADGGHNEMWAKNGALSVQIQAARDQRDVARFITGGLVERGAVIAERKRKGVDALVDFAETLDLFQAPAGALEVLTAAWNADRSNTSTTLKLLDTARAAGDDARAEEIRRVSLSGKHLRAGDNSPREFALELADLLAARGALDEALATLRSAMIGDPADFRLLQKQMHLLERAGRNEEANATLAKLTPISTGDARGKNTLALDLERRGDVAKAVEVRLRGGGGGDPQLPLVLYKNGQTDEALSALEKLSGNYAAYAAMTVAEAMGLRGDAKGARGVLIATASRVLDPRAQMQLRSKLLTIPGAPPTAEFAVRMQDRLRQIAAGQPELDEGYYEFFDRYAERFGIRKAWESEIATTWAEGAGPVYSGVIALRHRLAAGDEARARVVCEGMIARADVTSSLLMKLDREIAGTPHSALRLIVAEANARRSWPYAQATFDWVRLLDEQGKRERARGILTGHAWLASMPGGAAQLGAAWLSLADAEKARGFYQVALKQETPLPRPATLAGMARVHLATGNLPSARLLLRRAFADPTCREQAALVEYLEAAGSLPNWRGTLADFSLSAMAEFRLGEALFAYFEKKGRLGDALALVLSHPYLVMPRDVGDPDGAFPLITCERIRAFARKSGGYADTAQTVETLVAAHAPDAAAELAALHADHAAVTADSARKHLEAAVAAAPTRVEFSLALAKSLAASDERQKAIETIDRYLSVAQSPTDRDAALGLRDALLSKK